MPSYPKFYDSQSRTLDEPLGGAWKAIRARAPPQSNWTGVSGDGVLSLICCRRAPDCSKVQLEFRNELNITNFSSVLFIFYMYGNKAGKMEKSRERYFSNNIILQNVGHFSFWLSNQVACHLLLPLTLLKIVSIKH